MTEPAFDSARFRQVLGHFPTGVCIVSAFEGDEAPVGMAIGSFFSVSLDPPLVGFCAGKTSGVGSLLGCREVLREHPGRRPGGGLPALRLQGGRQVRRPRLGPLAARGRPASAARWRGSTADIHGGDHRGRPGARARRRRPRHRAASRVVGDGARPGRSARRANAKAPRPSSITDVQLIFFRGGYGPPPSPARARPGGVSARQLVSPPAQDEGADVVGERLVAPGVVAARWGQPVAPAPEGPLELPRRRRSRRSTRRSSARAAAGSRCIHLRGGA
jgi:hypothetical protein